MRLRATALYQRDAVPTLPPPKLASSDERRVLPYVAFVALLAGAALYALALLETSIPRWDPTATLVLAAIGIGAELLDYRHQKYTTGSIAFIPWTACALVAPQMSTALVVGASAALVQLFKRRPWLKATFNTVQFVLNICVAILVYRLLNGHPVALLHHRSVVAAARDSLPATLLTVATYSLLNTFTVSAAVAIVQRQSLVDVWRANSVLLTPFNLLAGLITFYLSWLYVNLGPLGAVGLALPMLAVRQLYKTSMQLTTLTEELLDLMVAAIEARDAYTSGHSRRVASASKIIARGLGLQPKEVERVGVAALLHDVGKIDEAFAPILAKDGRLTADEWELMKRHPIRSAELVGHLSTLGDIVRPVRHHHERWDGTGYPDGLAGPAIPIAARIITFADTLDAMTSDRPYRKALSAEEARTEILRCRGRQFDPEMCDRVVSSAVWPELYRMFRSGTHAIRARAS